MSESTQLSPTEAIRQVIAEGAAMDYVDVVDAVQKRYRIDVSSALVEQVHHDWVKNRQTSPNSRMNLQLASKLPDEPATPEPTVQAIDREGQPPQGNLVHALDFVRAVGGLKNAKIALAELEGVFHGSD